MNRAIDARDPLIMPVKTYFFLDGVREDPAIVLSSPG